MGDLGSKYSVDILKHKTDAFSSIFFSKILLPSLGEPKTVNPCGWKASNKEIMLCLNGEMRELSDSMATRWVAYFSTSMQRHFRSILFRICIA